MYFFMSQYFHTQEDYFNIIMSKNQVIQVLMSLLNNNKIPLKNRMST